LWLYEIFFLFLSGLQTYKIDSMESNNTHNLTQISSKLPVSIFARVTNFFISLFPVSKLNGTVVKAGTQSADTGISFDKHKAIINLLNQGKHYDEAAKIAEVAQEWKIDLGSLESNAVAVNGNAVWIDMEN
jgi:hypothetical protein